MLWWYLLQWLPPKWTHQVFYMIYRWLVAIYFLLWLVISVAHAADSIKFKYLIFLTHWGFLVWNAYLVLAALTVTIAYFRDNWSSQQQQKHQLAKFLDPERSSHHHNHHGCNSCRPVALYSPSPLVLWLACRLQWPFFLVGGEYAVVISVLYWVFYGNSPGHQQHNLCSMDSLNLHAINGIFAVLDLWLSGVPVRVYHALYSISFGCAYVLFTGVYYAADGRDSQGNRFIYPFLDYSSNPRAAAALALSCAVLFVGAVHFIFFLHYVVRKSITSTLHPTHYSTHYTPQCRSPRNTYGKACEL